MGILGDQVFESEKEFKQRLLKCQVAKLAILKVIQNYIKNVKLETYNDSKKIQTDLFSNQIYQNLIPIVSESYYCSMIGLLEKKQDVFLQLCECDDTINNYYVHRYNLEKELKTCIQSLFEPLNKIEKEIDELYEVDEKSFIDQYSAEEQK